MLEWYASQVWLLLKIVFCLFIIYELIKVVARDVKGEAFKSKRKTRQYHKR